MNNQNLLLSIIGTIVVQLMSSMVYGLELKNSDDVLANYKGKIVVLEDLDQDAKAFLINAEESHNPGVVRADLNGDGVEDIALLYNDGLKLMLQIYLCAKSCRVIETINVGSFYGIQYIVPVDKGKIIESVDRSRIKLDNTAISFVNYGKASAVYYWTKKLNGFASIATGD